MAENEQPRIERELEHAVYHNRYLTLYDDDVCFPNGHRGQYVRAVWQAPYSVAVLPVTAAGDYLLIRQYCYAREDWVLQVPKGFGVHAVEPIEMARVELREEAGLQAGNLVLLGTVYVDPGFISNPMHIFRASDVTHRFVPQHEPAELIGEVVTITRQLARDRTWFDSVIDAITRMAILQDMLFRNTSPVCKIL